MSDEAFARRFYSDRAELLALGVPLHSQRDEFTGEELYTLRSEQLLPAAARARPTTSSPRSRPASTCSTGKFAYAEPLRLALQNLALGRPGFARGARPRPPCASRCATPTTRAEMPGRLGKLETAISKQRTIKFPYRSMSTRRRRPSARSTRTRSCATAAAGTSSATISTARTSARSGSRASAATSASRRAASATSAMPADFDARPIRDRARGSSASIAGEAPRRAWRATPPGGSPRSLRRVAGRLEDGVFVTEYSSASASSPPGSCARTGAPCRSSPTTLRREVAEALARVREPMQGEPPSSRRRRRAATTSPPAERRPARSRRSASRVLQALLAYLLAACGDERDATIDRRARRATSRSRTRTLEEHLSLLNLVNFGGGCYAVYAELDGDVVRRRQGAVRRHLPAGRRV